MKRFKDMFEDGAVGTGAVAQPDVKLFKRKGKSFDVDTEVFRRFNNGRNKFERWSKYLNLEDASHKAIYDYAIRNRDATIILRDNETGAMRAITPRGINL